MNGANKKEEKGENGMNRRRVECQAIMMLWYGMVQNGLEWYAMVY